MAQVGSQFIHVQASNQFAEAALLQQIHFLQPLQVTPQLLQTAEFADPAIQALFEIGRLFVESHQFALASVLIDIGHNVEGKVEDALQVARGKVQQETN